jgi:hypothetical protein
VFPANRNRCRRLRRGRLERALEDQAHGGHVGNALFRVLLQATPEVDDGRERVREILARKRAHARQHLEQHRAKRPDVRAFIHHSAARLLGRHVCGGAEDHARLRHRGRRQRRRVHRVCTRPGRRIHRFREPEVEHLHRAVVANLDVRGLEIAMDDALLVRGLEGRGGLLRDRHRVGQRHRAARDVHGQILAFDEFHDQGARAPRLLDAVDGRDVRMIQRRQRFRFALKAREPVRVLCKDLRKDLDRDVAAQPRVGRAIDLAHAAGANRGDDFIRTEASTGGERHGLGSQSQDVAGGDDGRPLSRCPIIAT